MAATLATAQNAPVAIAVRNRAASSRGKPEPSATMTCPAAQTPDFRARWAMYDLTLYTAVPGTTSEDRLKFLAGLAASQPQAAEPISPKSLVWPHGRSQVPCCCGGKSPQLPPVQGI